MQKWILPALLAALLGLAFLPSHARAGGIIITVNPSGAYYNPGYGYVPRYYAVPVYSGYGQGYYDYTPSYNYAPSVYYNYTPSYQTYGGSYYPQYRNDWRGRDWDRHEWREHEEREEHERHEYYEHHRR